MGNEARRGAEEPPAPRQTWVMRAVGVGRVRGRQAGRKAGRQAGRQAGGQAGRQAGRVVRVRSRQAGSDVGPEAGATERPSMHSPSPPAHLPPMCHASFSHALLPHPLPYLSTNTAIADQNSVSELVLLRFSP